MPTICKDPQLITLFDKAKDIFHELIEKMWHTAGKTMPKLSESSIHSVMIGAMACGLGRFIGWTVQLSERDLNEVIETTTYYVLDGIAEGARTRLDEGKSMDPELTKRVIALAKGLRDTYVAGTELPKERS